MRVPLGPRMATGAADTTNNNPGNWTVVFDPSILNINHNPFICYKIVVQGAPGSTFSVYIQNNQWDAVQVGSINSWDPMNPMLLTPGQTVYFYYSDPVTDGIPPKVTMWLAYESS